MAVLFTSVPSKRLSRTLLSSGTAVFLENIQGWNGSNLAASDFSDQLYAVFRDAGNTVMELMELNPATIASASGITITRRGLAFTGDRTTELAARKLDWTKNTTIVELGTCAPQDLQFLKEYIDGIAIAGSPDSTTTTKGIGRISTAPVSPTIPIFVGDNDTRLPTTNQSAALAGADGSPSSTNKYLTQDTYADGSVDQSQTTQNASTAVGQANTTGNRNKFAQSFVAGKTKARAVSLHKAANTGTFTGTVTVSIQADSSGSPSGSSLATVTITNAVYNSFAVGEFLAPLTSNASMTVGSTYWVVIETSTSDTANCPNLGTNSAGGYGSGSTKYNNTTDGWVAVATIDLYFKIHEGLTSKTPKMSSGFVPAVANRLAQLASNTAGTSVTGTTAETTSYTGTLDTIAFSFPGRALRLSVALTVQMSSASAGENSTARIKIGGVTVATFIYASSAVNANTVTGIFEVLVWTNSDGTQSYHATNASSAVTNIATTSLSAYGNLANPITPSTASALLVTFQASATTTVSQVRSVIVEDV